jgi:hypothetical protein
MRQRGPMNIAPATGAGATNPFVRPAAGKLDVPGP